MKENMDQLEQAIKKEFERAAREEETAILEDEGLSMPEGEMESLYAGIQEKIEAMQQDELYAGLSEEDRKALEIGRKIMEEEAKGEIRAKTVRKKRHIRMYIGLAAVLVLVMAIGVTSMGGPERIIQMVTQMVGDREVEKVNSSEDNLIMVQEDEEEAYQKIREVFGVDPVRIIERPKGMKFVKMQLDEKLQIAEMYFEYNEDQIFYLINASYSGSSWGIDVEEQVIKKYEKEIEGCLLDIKEYEALETNANRYSVSFQYNDLEYYFMGTMMEEEINVILNNLFFPK